MTWIGIMQGRLLPPIGDRLQSFPSERWQEEFQLAGSAGLDGIEWIYDTPPGPANPLTTEEGRARLRDLSSRSGVQVRSVCADYFMEHLLLRGELPERAQSFADLRALISWAQDTDARRIVLPFVDSSEIETDREAENAVACLASLAGDCETSGIEIHLETSMPPLRFGRLLEGLPHPWIRVNYDSGNSASLGYRPREEFAAYGDRIGSVHIKDRVLGGKSVPLGTGDTDFDAVFGGLRDLRYAGSFVLQAARGGSGQEVDWARSNRKFVELGWRQSGD